MPTWKIAARTKKDIVEHLLSLRDIKSKEDKELFFSPRIEHYIKETEISGILEAKVRIEKALKNKETIFVYGDYDVDGVSASAVVYHGLKSLGANILPYIPHRDKEGYGLSKIGLDEIKSKGASLVITVDHGIVAFEQAKYAKSLGLDLIITDHHANLEKLPEAVSIVHSIKMCGAGVAWCLMKNMVSKEEAQELLQFVCLGTIADMIPLTGLGRAFVYEGLKEINKSKNVGLKALILEAGLEFGKISAFEVGFILSPRLNAIGRLEHAIDALRLLCTKDLLKATRLARLLCDTNSARQKLTTLAYEEAKQKIVDERRIYVLDSPKWVSGIIGLVAAKICEEYSRPVIAISVGEEFSKGSARTSGGINIVESIRTCSDILVNVGGHAGAAGFTIETSKIEDFKKRLDDHFNKMDAVSYEDLLEIEAEVTKEELTRELVDKLDKFEPFGAGNPRPLLATYGMSVDDIRTVGEGKHLKINIEGIDAIGFGMGQMLNSVKPKDKVDVAYYLEINRFNGREILQLRLKDIKPQI